MKSPNHNSKTVQVFLCPVCNRWIGEAGGRKAKPTEAKFHRHLNSDKKICEGSSLLTQGRPSRHRAKNELARDLRLIHDPPAIDYNVIDDPGRFRIYYKPAVEGLCETCKRWFIVNRSGRIRLHNTELASRVRCTGIGSTPIRTRPRGAWKRRPQKRGNDVEATSEST